jgi:hypothetical protein
MVQQCMLCWRPFRECFLCGLSLGYISQAIRQLPSGDNIKLQHLQVAEPKLRSICFIFDEGLLILFQKFVFFLYSLCMTVSCANLLVVKYHHMFLNLLGYQ